MLLLSKFPIPKTKILVLPRSSSSSSSSCRIGFFPRLQCTSYRDGSVIRLIRVPPEEFRAFKRLLARSPGFIETLQRNLNGITWMGRNPYSSKKRGTNLSNTDESSSSSSNDDDDRKQPDKKLIRALIQMLFPMFIFYMLLSSMSRSDNGSRTSQEDVNAKSVSWNEFYNNMLMTGEVEKVVIYPSVKRAIVYLYPGAIYKGRKLNNIENVFRMDIPNAENLEDRIREVEARIGIGPGQGMSIVYDRGLEGFSKLFGAILICIVIGAVFFMMRNLGTGVADQFSKITKADFTLVNSHIRKGRGVKFSDVAGLKEAKIEVREFVDYLKNPNKYRELGAKPPKGAILFGPPGCGKTLLAKAVANESGVPFLSMNGSEFIEMIGGVGAARVRSLFKEARKRSPSIIYIDEIDAIGRQRGGGGGGMQSGGGGSGTESEQTLNQLLVEMDGMSSKDGVIILASTNRADVLDRALLRPGRFDRHITIDSPTVIERKEILEQHMKGVVLDEESSKYSERLATLTPGFSGADLANLINEAALHAARHKHEKVGVQDLEYAIERVIAGPEKKSSSLSAPERRVVAYHEAGHALVGWMLQHTDALLKVTIIPRTSMALGFAQYTPVDKKLFSPEELRDRMCMALGGRVAESLTFNKITTGAQNDLQKVTKMAYAQIRQFGFNENVGLVSFEDTSGGKPAYGKKLQATMDFEARKLITNAYQITEMLLKEHSDKLELLAEQLLERETLNYDDVEKLLGPPKYGKKYLVSPVDYEASLSRQSNLGSSEGSSI